MSGRAVVLLRITGTLQADRLEQLQAFLNDIKAQGVDIEAAVQGPAWLCGVCNLLSVNPSDAANKYCGCCGNEELPRNCTHRQCPSTRG